MLFVIAGVGLLIYRGISDTGVYYMTVEELIEKAPVLKDDSVRISGNVVADSIDYNQKELILSFAVSDIENPAKTIDVLYNGVVPDAFTSDVEVVLEGVYKEDRNLFLAETLLAKCPSKYESEIKEEEE